MYVQILRNHLAQDSQHLGEHPGLIAHKSGGMERPDQCVQHEHGLDETVDDVAETEDVDDQDL